MTCDQPSDDPRQDFAARATMTDHGSYPLEDIDLSPMMVAFLENYMILLC